MVIVQIEALVSSIMNIFVKSVKFKFNLLKNSEVRAKQNRLFPKQTFSCILQSFKRRKKKDESDLKKDYSPCRCFSYNHNTRPYFCLKFLQKPNLKLKKSFLFCYDVWREQPNVLKSFIFRIRTFMAGIYQGFVLKF